MRVFDLSKPLIGGITMDNLGTFKRIRMGLFSSLVAAFLLAAMSSFAADMHTSTVFQGVKVNGGTVTHSKQYVKYYNLIIIFYLLFHRFPYIRILYQSFLHINLLKKTIIKTELKTHIDFNF